jgi:hypothetical protein
MNDSLAAMAASADRCCVSAAEWSAVVRKRRKIWFNPSMRILGERCLSVRGANRTFRAGRRLVELTARRSLVKFESAAPDVAVSSLRNLIFPSMQ